eukprot:3794190-Pyramimonas_sp.AAC.1
MVPPVTSTDSCDRGRQRQRVVHGKIEVAQHKCGVHVGVLLRTKTRGPDSLHSMADVGVGELV